jgi:xylan 1,4-beta-xylosidase
MPTIVSTMVLTGPFLKNDAACVVLVSLPHPALAQAPKTFVVDASNVTGVWTHFFEECVGSGHAALALRADWQEQMRQTKLELGFKEVRFHGLFVDDMSVVLPSSNGTGVQFSFFNMYATRE